MQRISSDGNEERAEDDDYSASASAILQKRSSSSKQSKRKRRPSSPFSAADIEYHSNDINMGSATVRRRSSAYTITSGDTAISMEEGSNQEQIYEKLKLHKEVLSGVKQQPWPLRKKIKLVRQAKAYVRRHEGALQERLAQRRCTKDIIARISLLITKKWQYFRREFINLETWCIPWELRIKEIESHFGSAVASYFIFLRWLFWINLVISATLTAFVAIPEVLTADMERAGERKIMLKEERIKSKHLLTLWEFEGILKYSPFFYGWYTNEDKESGYRLPLAYFVTNLVVYVYSFVAILRKMAENSRMSKLTEKKDECVFSWKLFTGWDFMIGNPETGHNRIASIVLGFKEALLEEAEKQKDKRNWKVISMRIFVNICVIALLGLSAFAVIKVVARSAEEEAETNWWRQNEITIVMSLISYVFPIFFEILGIFERYHPRKQLRLQLARIMVLNLLNLYSLIFALFDKINHMEDELDHLKQTNTSCIHIPVPCTADMLNLPQPVATLTSLSLVLIKNLTSSNIETGVKNLHYSAVPFITKSINHSSHDHLHYGPLITGDYLDYYDYNDTSEEYYNEDGEILDEKSDNNGENEILKNITLIHGKTYSENFHEYPTDLYEDYTDNDEDYYYNEENNETTTIDNSFNRTTNDIEKTTIFNDLYYNETYTSEVTMPVNISETTPIDTVYGTNTNTDLSIENTITSTATEESTPTFKTTTEKNIIKCFVRTCTTSEPKIPDNLGPSSKRLDSKTRRELRQLCWETMFGQELAKLTVMDLVLTILSTLCMDFFRALFVRFMNNCWCWDLEKQFPQYGDFKIAENILHLVNNQGMVWMGMFFSPGLTALNLLKLGILMYLRSWAVLTCNVPHEVVFRASRSNNFYFALLLTMLFLCVLPVGYAIVWVEPSWHCGPFSGYHRIYNLATKSLQNSLPGIIQRCLDYIASPGIVIPLIVLMTLVIYYMASLIGSLREANNDLKIQLRHERTEERRKLFKIVENRQDDTKLLRWKKLMPMLPQKKIKKPSTEDPHVILTIGDAVKLQMQERQRSTISDAAEMTDVEQDSLPHDQTLPQHVNDDLGEKNSPSMEPVIPKIINIAVEKMGDSCESQSSIDYGGIPEIRINKIEGKSDDPNSLTHKERTT